MSDEMLERRIRETLDRAAPREIPLTLELRVARIPETMPVDRHRRPRVLPRLGRVPAAIGSIAVVVAVLVFAATTLPYRFGPTPAGVWEPIQVDGITGGTVLQVVSGPAGFLAVGADDLTAMLQHPRIWSSPDGRSWRPAADVDLQVAGSGSFAVSAAAWGRGWVVIFGTNALTSSDGQHWTESNLGEMTGFAVASVGNRIVAIGEDDLKEEGGWPTPAVATSTDGITWTAAPTFASGTHVGTLWGVSAVAGGFLTYGWVHENSTIARSTPKDSPEFVAAGIPWFSSDGLTWTRVAEASDTRPFGWMWVAEVVRGGHGYLAVGHPATDLTARVLWTSPDGRSWTRATATPPFASVSDAGIGLGGDGRTMTAFIIPDARHESQLWGSVAPPPGIRTVAWTTTDGVAWEDSATSDTFGGARLVDVVPSNGKLLAFGNAGAPRTECPWLPPLAAGATENPDLPQACNRLSAWSHP